MPNAQPKTLVYPNFDFKGVSKGPRIENESSKNIVFSYKFHGRKIPKITDDMKKTVKRLIKRL